MACEIAHGRAEVCRDSVGGIQAIYFINNQIASTDVSYDGTNTDMITAITNVDSLYKYELRGENTFDQDIVSDENAGTTLFSQKLNIKLKKQDTATSKLVKLLSYGRPHVVVRTNNNQFFIAGLEFGLKVTGGGIMNGTAMKDFNGYSLSFVGEERCYANHLNASTEAAMVTLFTSASLVTS